MAYRFIAIGLLMFVGAQVLNSEARFRTFGFAVTLFGAGVALLAILQGVDFTQPNLLDGHTPFWGWRVWAIRQP